jgi:hypothetical protein
MTLAVPHLHGRRSEEGRIRSLRIVVLMLLALAAGALAGAISAPAAAEVGTPKPTVEASAAYDSWLAYDPPPSTPGVVCLVDSGIDLNPDTEAALVGSDALYPETNTGDEIAALMSPIEPGDHPDGHGTLMAMLISAPLNGWGLVGLAPSSVRVFNMKALDHGSTTFSEEAIAGGIERCVRLHESTIPSLNVISLSLAGESSPTPAEESEAEQEIVHARDVGISVVAAAGNDAGAVEFPASYAPVLAVGADNAGAAPGTLCAFSAFGERLDLLAPGCDTQIGGIEGAFQDTGEPSLSNGTSQATALASAALSALRAYAPSLSLQSTEGCLTSTTVNGELDVAAAFDACGLGANVEEGEHEEAAVEAASSSAGDSTSSSGSQTNSSQSTERVVNVKVCSTQCSTSKPGSSTVHTSSFERRCAAPRLAAAARHGTTWRLRVRRRASGCVLRARARSERHRRLRWHMLAGHGAQRLTVRAPAGTRLEVRFQSPSGAAAPSRWVTVAEGHN